MIMTSGYNIEGYNIVSYLGHESMQVVLGTGFFSATSVAVSDLFGTTSNSYENKLNDAEQLAKKRLKSRAISMGGNAIIGIDVDYTVFVNDVMGVIVSGTVVQIEKIDKEDKFNKGYLIPVLSYMPKLPFNISNIELIQDLFSRNINGLVEIVNYDKNKNVSAFIADVDFEDILGNTYTISDRIFVLEKNVPDRLCSLNMPIINVSLNIINKAYIKVKKYLLDDSEQIYIMRDEDYNKSSDFTIKDLESMRNVFGKDVVCNTIVSDDKWLCYCGYENEISSTECVRCHRQKNGMNIGTTEGMDKIFAIIESASTTKELLESLAGMTLPNKDEVIDEIKKTLSLERMYGKMTDAAKKKAKELITKDI